MQKSVFLTVLLCLLVSNSAFSQSFQDFEWVLGSWKGEAFGGEIYEDWQSPKGDEMIGIFQLVNGDKNAIIEMKESEPNIST